LSTATSIDDKILCEVNDMAKAGRPIEHGGEKAVKQIQHGEPLTGPAAAAQLEVRADYEAGGAPAMIREQAERLHTASRLYWEAFLAACTAQNLDLLDGYAARFGWLASSALRAWEALERTNKGKGSRIDAVLAAYKDKETGQNNPQEGQGEAE
jgi:hypothetical protein